MIILCCCWYVGKSFADNPVLWSGFILRIAGDDVAAASPTALWDDILFISQNS